MTETAIDQPTTRGKGDWVLAASMLAEGRGVMETARAAGVCRTTLWRALTRSADFGRLIERRRAELAAESGGRLESLRALVAGGIEEKVREGDTRTLLWIARELGMVGGNSVLFDRLPAGAAAEPNLEKIERAASGEAEPPLPPDADLHEMRRALIKYRGGVNHFREESERLQAELQALKAATGAAQMEPAANSVAFVPNRQNG